MSIYNYNFVRRLHSLINAFIHHNEAIIATKKANVILYKQIIVQSKLMSISDLFALCALLTFLMIPLAFLLKINKQS